MYAQQVTFTSTTTEYDYTQVNLEYGLGQFLYLNNVTDTVNLTADQIELDTLFRIYETLNLSGSSNAHIEALKSIVEVLSASNGIYVLQQELINDEIDYSETIQGTINKIARIVDTYNLSADPNNKGEFISIVSVVLALLDFLNHAFVEQLTDTVNLAEVINNQVIAYARLIDQIVFSEALPSQSLTIVLNDRIDLSESSNNIAELISVLTDSISFFGSLNFDGVSYLAYAVNTQSNGITEYTNHNFNSFAYPYATTNTGIYKFDDSGSFDGANINASIRTGITDFGTSLKKQVPYAYLGIAENGRVLLKTISTDRGVKKERWYEVQSYTDATDTTRVRMGKGVKAKYWQFELSNIEGEKLSLESMEVTPIVLNRRKQ